MTKKKLTAKQEIFVKEYLVDLNATQAAIRAGYSEKTAQEIGSENLSKPIIQEAVQAERDKRAQKLEITADKIAKNIMRISDKAESSGELHTALKGQMDLAKLLGLIVDKAEIKHSFEDMIDDL